jgi:hypothetical protein
MEFKLLTTNYYKENVFSKLFFFFFSNTPNTLFCLRTIHFHRTFFFIIACREIFKRWKIQILQWKCAVQNVENLKCRAKPFCVETWVNVIELSYIWHHKIEEYNMKSIEITSRFVQNLILNIKKLYWHVSLF